MARQRSVIAVVDDDLDMLNTVASLLSAHGYGTEEYASAEEFLIAAAASKATCLVVDIQLGDISGVELMRQLRAIGSRCPVMFMTGSRDDVIRQQAMDLGCVSYLHKPFPASQLLRDIQKRRSDRNPEQCSSPIALRVINPRFRHFRDVRVVSSDEC